MIIRLIYLHNILLGGHSGKVTIIIDWQSQDYIILNIFLLTIYIVIELIVFCLNNQHLIFQGKYEKYKIENI